MHFSHLEELPDQFYLLREAADALRTQGHFREALRYYEPIRSSDTQLDRQFFRDLLQCYRELGMVEEVEECWRILARSRQGDSDLAGRHELIRFLIEAGQEDRIAPYQAELAWKRRRKFKLMTGLNHRDSDLSLETPSNDMELLDDNLHSKCDPYANPIPGTQGRRKGVMPSLEEQEDVEPIFAIMRDLKARLDDGDAEARTRWKRHAYSLVEVFRQATVFFPYDRNVKFFGYSAEARQRAMATKKRVQEMDEERAVQLVIPLSESLTFFSIIWYDMRSKIGKELSRRYRSAFHISNGMQRDGSNKPRILDYRSALWICYGDCIKQLKCFLSILDDMLRERFKPLV